MKDGAEKCRVLVVEDEDDILQALSLLLEDEGYEVLRDNGKAAEEKVKEGNPDIILLDILLSGASGANIAKKLKEDPTTAHIPVILMSAHPDVKKMVQTSHADNFIPKPFEISEVLSTLKRYWPKRLL